MDSRDDPSTDSEFDFGSFTIPHDGLVVVVAQGHRELTRSISSVSIGGVNGALPVTANNSFAPRAIATRYVTAGNHNVTVTFNNPMLNATVSVFVLRGYASETPTTHVPVTNTTDALAMELNYPPGGVGIYGVHHYANQDTNWSAAGAGAVHDFYVDTVRYACAYKTAAGGANTETASWSGSAVSRGIAAVRTPSVAAQHRKYHATNTLQTLFPLIASEK